jgi:hypothetical protein
VTNRLDRQEKLKKSDWNQVFSRQAADSETKCAQASAQHLHKPHPDSAQADM